MPQLMRGPSAPDMSTVGDGWTHDPSTIAGGWLRSAHLSRPSAVLRPGQDKPVRVRVQTELGDIVLEVDPARRRARPPTS